jgi:hypothetical protein
MFKRGRKMKKYKNFLFVPFEGLNSISADTSDGYITSVDGRRIKLPHKNYQPLGIADECVNAPYAEIFAEELVDKDEFGNYFDYELEVYYYKSAVDSVQTLFRILQVEPTDYVLKEKTEPFTITIFET